MKKMMVFIFASLMILALGTTGFATTVLLSSDGSTGGYGYGHSS